MKHLFLLLMIYMTGYAQQPCMGVLTVKYEGRLYNTVMIGTQCWLKENLNVGKQINGSTSQLNNGIIEKYCYNDDSANCNNYGGLYQWGEAMQYDSSEKTKGICPDGWHIPDNAEFDTLSKYVHGKGNSLKTINQGKENGIGTNISGFSALLSGYLYINGVFYRYKKTACFWSSTKFSNMLVNNMNLNEKDNDVSLDKFNITNGFSVRCILDY